MSQAAPRSEAVEDLKKLIREVPDFPKPGILFYDITTLLKNADGYRRRSTAGRALPRPGSNWWWRWRREVSSSAPGCHRLGAGFVPVRKLGKLPAETVRVEYALEYGIDTLEIHKDAIQPGQKVLIVDDLLATGGTAAACARLVTSLGGEVVGIGFAVELTFLKGRDKLREYEVFSLLKYNS